MLYIVRDDSDPLGTDLFITSSIGRAFEFATDMIVEEGAEDIQVVSEDSDGFERTLRVHRGDAGQVHVTGRAGVE